MTGGGRLAIGFAAAAVVAAATAAVVMETPAAFVLALPVAALHVALIGAPVYLLLRRKLAPSALSILAGGFLTGAIPLFLFLAFASAGYGGRGTNVWSNGVQTIADGALTAAGWLELVAAAGYFGGCGLAGGLAFWLITRTPRAAE